MKRRLIIDGNAVYELDEQCMLKKRVTENSEIEEKRKAKRDVKGDGGK